ncbi:MFS general substrate transporter [Rhizodiscina lignyota]|uniref:MFS general substrate transporter n=1 Tax=Rhizodiscina lignyota TaxID=1504668 RepID=A0A9P4I617_9PEZI|nr:MFS general substrate transporter [Rhizodiscina lignyota]
MREALESHLDEDAARVRRILWKVDLRLVPMLSLLYMWAFIDRSNLGNANIAGMSEDLKTNVGNRYSVLAMIFFIGYCLIDIPAAFIARKVGPALWIGVVGTLWGIITLAQGFVKTWGQLAVCRALLGFLEGGLVPAAMYLLSVWYPRYNIHVRIAGFYVIGNFSSGLSGLLAYGIEKMAGDSGYNGWSWIFIIEGIVSTVVGIASFFILVDFPEKAAVKNSLGLPGFLTPEEAAIILARIEHDRGDAVEDKMNFRIAMKHFRDWKLWEFSAYLTLNNTALYAFSYFLPVILKDGFGYSTGKAQVMTFPPYCVGACWIMAVSFIGDHYKIRGPILAFNCLLYIIGVSMTGYATNVHTRYAGVFLGVIGIIGNVPTQWAYQHNNMVGQNKKALTMACMVMGGAFGGIISGNIFQAKDAPGYRSGLWICIAFQIVYFFLVCKNFVIFYIQNKRADRGEIIIEGQPGFRHTY